ncbi:hypothetical protein ZOSMA_114G00110 [Zostera marina]|uniref:Uncharacterized protein n=1 Tax=Zostera marina TaxID=29655 RepID=A0A0K9Q2I8_ZOSMR|nr:hypothetical protein ZOSMA_114G00110 [Zostera marina]
MGNCKSCDVITVTTSNTAKVIFPDGHLQEYSDAEYVRVSQALSNVVSKDSSFSSDCFLCNADDLDFEGHVSPVHDDARLQAGQIYFVLPLSLLRRKLYPEDIAALAVRASTALVHSGATLVPRDVELVMETGKTRKDLENETKRMKKRRRRSDNSGRGRDFLPELGAIME